MERVTGVGGVFLRARDPQALATWYRDMLGIPVDPESAFGALASTGPDEQTIWAAFPVDTDYFGARSAQCMINYRVRSLDAMLAQLRAAGAPVEERIEDAEYGRFGWATDPEGNRFELWEPPGG